MEVQAASIRLYALYRQYWPIDSLLIGQSEGISTYLQGYNCSHGYE